MSIVTNNPVQPQLRLRCHPLRGSKAAYCYDLNVPGFRMEVNHSFAEWTVDDFRETESRKFYEKNCKVLP